MSFLQSIYRHFSPGKVQLIVGDDVADLWPSPPQCDTSSLAARREVVGKGATEKSEKDASMAEVKKSLTDPIDLPAIERDSDGLLHSFMQKCVEIAVGQQVKEQALIIAQEKLVAAVAYHNILRQDYLTLCSAVARVSALRPWYRSEKYLAETRIRLEATRGPVREEDFWAPGKTIFDDHPLQEKFGPFPTREVVTRWDEGSWTVRSFKLLPVGDDAESCYDSSSEASQEDESSTKPGRELSMSSLRSLLQNDLEAIPNDDYDDDDGDVGTASPTRATHLHGTSSWPSPDLAKKDRKQIRRLCERHVDPRRSSIEMEERAVLKASLRDREDLVTHLWERIKHIEPDRNPFDENDTAQVVLCSQILQTITEIEIGWEVHKETTSAERNRAQLLVLKMQWDLNGSQRLNKNIEAIIGDQRQKQMDVWQDIVCAAALRGTPPAQETNIFGSVLWYDDEGEVDRGDGTPMLALLPRSDEFEATREKSPEVGGREEQDAELFGPLESDTSGIEQDGKCSQRKSDAQDLRTMRLDSGFEG